MQAFLTLFGVAAAEITHPRTKEVSWRLMRTKVHSQSAAGKCSISRVSILRFIHTVASHLLSSAFPLYRFMPQ
jgi:hypothetical protein